jgi:hypothetical protein
MSRCLWPDLATYLHRNGEMGSISTNENSSMESTFCRVGTLTSQHFITSALRRSAC